MKAWLDSAFAIAYILAMHDPSQQIGENIKLRRRNLGMTLDGLAGKSGVSSTMISEVERGLKNPTVRVAYNVARALSCTLTDLLGEQPALPLTVERVNERPAMVDPETGLERRVLSHPFLERSIEHLHYTLPPQQSTGSLAPNRHGVLECLVVLSGRLHFQINGEEIVLGPQDSVTHGPATVEYCNKGRRPCQYMVLLDSSKASGATSHGVKVKRKRKAVRKKA